jgi:hypothetical protein
MASPAPDGWMNSICGLVSEETRRPAQTVTRTSALARLAQLDRAFQVKPASSDLVRNLF